MKKLIEIIASGDVYCSVCAPEDLTINQVTEQVNFHFPAGDNRQWAYSENTTFEDGSRNPCHCDKFPMYFHYIFNR